MRFAFFAPSLAVRRQLTLSFHLQFYEQYIYDAEEGAAVSAAEFIEDVDEDNVSFWKFLLFSRQSRVDLFFPSLFFPCTSTIFPFTPSRSS